MSEGLDLWCFRCQYGHGDFDVWGTDWRDVPNERRPRPDLEFEPEDVRATRCPACLVTGEPVGPPENLA